MVRPVCRLYLRVLATLLQLPDQVATVVSNASKAEPKPIVYRLELKVRVPPMYFLSRVNDAYPQLDTNLDAVKMARVPGKVY